eukprot:TRINITY_DN34272_c0_g1_i1.p1 TRINITY_DN34272_c0_g1~~TRINITY_DN34272_c0_g1_i1.p1  ORF type:complete len:318 (+),score=57.45 TRINITY_DN34272_c0_g1_i1:124-1077(+)
MAVASGARETAGNPELAESTRRLREGISRMGHYVQGDSDGKIRASTTVVEALRSEKEAWDLCQQLAEELATLKQDHQALKKERQRIEEDNQAVRLENAALRMRVSFDGRTAGAGEAVAAAPVAADSTMQPCKATGYMKGAMMADPRQFHNTGATPSTAASTRGPSRPESASSNARPHALDTLRAASTKLHGHNAEGNHQKELIAEMLKTGLRLGNATSSRRTCNMGTSFPAGRPVEDNTADLAGRLQSWTPDSQAKRLDTVFDSPRACSRGGSRPNSAGGSTRGKSMSSVPWESAVPGQIAAAKQDALREMFRELRA